MSYFVFPYSLEHLSLLDNELPSSEEVTHSHSNDSLDNPGIKSSGKVSEIDCDKHANECDKDDKKVNGLKPQANPQQQQQQQNDLQQLEFNLDFQLRTLWEKAMQDDLFRYKLGENSLPSKVLPGKFNYIAQLNPDRAEKRRKPQQIQSVNQPFSPDQFNFNKITSKEILGRFQPWYSSQEEDHLLLINVSPLEYGHVLLTPFRNKNQPQNLTTSGFRLALELLLLNTSPNFRLGFNSLCGYASVNHEHYHAYYLSHRLFLEYAELELITGNCYQVKDPEYPPGFCFILKGHDHGHHHHHPISEARINILIDSVMKLAKYLQENNVAHNVYITRGSTKNILGHFDVVRVFIWARESSFGAKGCDAFNPALCELAGHFPIKNEAAYESLTEENILSILHAICDKPFQQVRSWILTNF